MGMASVIHHVPIHTVVANTSLPSKESCCCPDSPTGINITIANNRGPTKRPILPTFFREIVSITSLLGN
jgi:hypothetical protein